jgi:HD-like signal output (HDOD) protein/CheY-like chemotaxis protein
MPRVIFVDDEPNILNGLRRNLVPYRRTWEMVFVSDGHEAIREFERESFDVIVSDFRMPGMDGGQLLRTVRERWPDAGRILLSGHTDEQDLYEVLSVTQRFLDKPCDRVVLVTAIEQVLSLRDAFDLRPLRAQIGALETLPSARHTLRVLQDMLAQPEPSPVTVADVIQRDIGLTIKVLQLANSSLFGPTSRISSVRKGVERLGIEAVRSIALMRGLVEPVRETGSLNESWLEMLNRSAGQTARLASQMVAPELALDAFCAGLAEECGQLVFAACRPEALQRLIGDADTCGPNASLEIVEFGVSHAQAGAYLLNLWGFSTTIVDAVATHDQQAHQSAAQPQMSVSEAVRLARDIASHDLPGLCNVTEAAEPKGRLHQELQERLSAQEDSWLPYETGTEAHR